MPRFLPQYKELDIRPQWERIIMIASFVILFLLAPTIVLGYYSETSLPGQPLYPLKRGIESMVLLVETFTPYNKSLYYQTLATRRVNEAATVVAQAAASGDFSSADISAGDIALNDAVLTVQQAVTQTNSIADPAQKQQAKQQLTEAIRLYQTQLTQINYTIQSHLITPTPTPIENQTTGNSPTPTPTSVPQDTTTSLQTQITQTQDALTNITNDLQETPTPTSTPIPTNTPTPTPRQGRDQHDQRERQ